MTAFSNKVKVVPKTTASPSAALPTNRPGKADPAVAGGDSPDAGSRRRIDLAHLQITGNDAISLAAAMKVVGAEPSGESRRSDVRMPASQATLVDGLSGRQDSRSAAAPAEEAAAQPSVQMMLQLHRESGGSVSRPKAVGNSAASEVRQAARPRREAACKPEIAGEIDPCLVRLMAVWPRLPQKIRDAIAAIVNSMEQG